MTSQFDAFISHASENKKNAAKPIADALIQAGLRVFYDDYSLRVGDSLLRSINRGLACSRFGVVIFSKAFFRKKWPQDELAALYALEDVEEPRILPVWYRITKAEIARHAPLLLDKKAANLSQGLDRTVEFLLRRIAPELLHKTAHGLTLSLTPNEVRLTNGGYRCTNRITVYNPSDHPVYSVMVKCLMQPSDLKAEDVEVSGLEASQGIDIKVRTRDYTMYGNAVRYNCIDSAEREAVFILLHTINPKESVQFVVRGPASTADASASLEIAGFDLVPAPMLEKDNAAVLTFSFPEKVKLKGVSLRISSP